MKKRIQAQTSADNFSSNQKTISEGVISISAIPFINIMAQERIFLSFFLDVFPNRKSIGP